MTRISNRLLALAAIALLAVCNSSDAAEWGTFRGRFVYDGTPPKEPKIDVTKDVEVCGKHDLHYEDLIVGSDGGLANVAVWVMKKNIEINPEYEKEAGKTIVYDNKGCRFNPHVLAIWTKQTLELHNSDPIGHNSNMTVVGGESINPLLPPDAAAKYDFAKAPVLPTTVTCNIHPWMKGYIVARDNPYTAISKADGTFEIKDLPVGEIEFRAWHEKSGYIQYDDWSKGRFKFDIKAGDNDLGTIKLNPDQFNK